MTNRKISEIRKKGRAIITEWINKGYLRKTETTSTKPDNPEVMVLERAWRLNKTVPFVQDMIRIFRRTFLEQYKPVLKEMFPFESACILSGFITFNNYNTPDILIITNYKHKTEESMQRVEDFFGVNIKYLILTKDELVERFIGFDPVLDETMREGVVLWSDELLEYLAKDYNSISYRREYRDKKTQITGKGYTEPMPIRGFIKRKKKTDG